MKYKHLVDKIIGKQNKIFDAIDELNPEKVDVAPLVEKEAGAKLWALSAGDEKLGEAEVPVLAPDIDPLVEFSNLVSHERGLFSDHIQSEIEEYTELVKELFQMVNEAYIEPM